MKIGILGTGVIGTMYGWALSQKHEVKHIVRPEKADEWNGYRFQIDMIDERQSVGNQNVIDTYKIAAQPQADESFDLIIVPVAEEQSEQALKCLTLYAPQTKYLLMTSNWKGTQVIDCYLSKKQYILGYAGGGGTIRQKGSENELWGNIGADIITGAVFSEQKDLLNTVNEMFREIDIIPEVPSNILHWLWIHNIDSAAMGVGLHKYDRMSDFLQDRKLIKNCFDAMLEGFSICGQRGVNLGDFPEVQMYEMPFEKLYPMFKGNFETNPVMQRYSAHAVHAIPEMIYNFRQIYQTGKKQGALMPNMEELYQYI